MISLFYTKAKKIYKQKQNRKQEKKYLKDNRTWISNNSVLYDGANDECFIIGNGPSIKDFDFSLLKGKDIMTLNQIARNQNFDKLDIKYHFWADPMFFYEDENHNKAISDDMYVQMQKVISKNPICVVVSPLNNGVVKDLIKEGAKIYRYPAFSETNNELMRLEPRLSEVGPVFYNVMQYAIYSAICLGYKKIFLLGCEQTSLLTILNTKLNDATDTSNYGYVINKNEKERMIEHYKKCSVAKYLYQHAKMFDDFAWLRKLADINSVTIVNCTPKSLVDSFEHKELNDVLVNKK